MQLRIRVSNTRWALTYNRGGHLPDLSKWPLSMWGLHDTIEMNTRLTGAYSWKMPNDNRAGPDTHPDTNAPSPEVGGGHPCIPAPYMGSDYNQATRRGVSGRCDTGPVRGCLVFVCIRRDRSRAWNVCRENAGPANGCGGRSGEGPGHHSGDSSPMIRQLVSGRSGKRNKVCVRRVCGRRSCAVAVMWCDVMEQG